MDTSARIYVAGSRTSVGRAIIRRLHSLGYSGVIEDPAADDLPTDFAWVDRFFARTAPEYVVMAAGRSGGILANQTHPVELMLDNLLAGAHMISAAWRHGVRKLLYLGSSCMYPRECPQPMRVASLGSGPLEPTSDAYAVAKIAGMTLCEAYRREYGANFFTAILADAFGPGDNFDPDHSHVIPALLRRMHEAKLNHVDEVAIWGTGTAQREFIFVDDLADACVHVMGTYGGPDPINVGGGTAMSIRQVAEHVKQVVGYDGALRFDPNKPDGMPMKLLDTSALRALGWRPPTPLLQGLAATYEWYLETLRVPHGG